MRNFLLFFILFMLCSCGATPFYREHPSPSNGYRGFHTSDGASADTLFDTMNWMCEKHGGLDYSSIRKEELDNKLDALILSAASFRCNAYKDNKNKQDEYFKNK